jgi:hypothetical protein
MGCAHDRGAPQVEPPAARILALVTLAAAWIAVLVWLWADETSLSRFAYTTSGPTCADLAEQEMRRFNTWFIPTLIAGPALGVVLRFAMRPMRPASPRSRPGDTPRGLRPCVERQRSTYG